MDKFNESRSTRSRWKDDNRHPKLYDERTNQVGTSQTGTNSSQNGKIIIKTTTVSNSRYGKSDLIDISSKASQINQNLPEDMRISKLLRRLETETSTLGVIDICKKLIIAIQDQTNSRYIHRSFDILANSTINVMKDCNQEALPHLSKVFGMMGFVMLDEFPQYKSWLCKTYKTIKSLRVPMMSSLENTLKMDRDAELSNQIARLMELLRDFLEQSDVADTFIAITKVLMTIAKNYERHFKVHFTNVVDIIVGWHLETAQKAAVKMHCSIVLQSFKKFWESDTKFTLDLLGQLLEDIEACNDKLNQEGGVSESQSKEFGSFVGVFNTIIKCIFATPETLVGIMGKTMIEESYEKVLQVAIPAVNVSRNEELIMSVNEFILIMLSCRQNDITINMNDVLNVIESELEHVILFNENQLASFFSLVVKFIDEFKSNMPSSLIEKLLNVNGTLVNYIRFNSDERVKSGMMKMYHDILALKNVPVLQLAYKLILDDIGASLKRIPELAEIAWETTAILHDVPESSRKTSLNKAQFSLIFNLEALSILATTQNSIIAMYSLSPSILEALMNLQIWRQEYWAAYDVINFAVLKLLSAHCMKNSNFVSSSSLFVDKNLSSAATTSSWLSDSSPTESPVSQHFKLVLSFLDKMLKGLPSLKVIQLILDWLEKIIQQTAQFSEPLKENQQFISIIKHINRLSVKYNDEVAVKVANCNDFMYAFDSLHSDILASITEVCGVQMCSVDPEIRRRYSFILSRIPLRYTLEEAKSPSGINRDTINKISEMENWHLSTGSIHGGELRAQYFQEFINCITFSPEATNIDDFIQNAFKNCWFNGTEMAEEYKSVTLKDVRTLTSWIQWEAARFCVNNRLKTPLGRPQDTFVKIESIIKDHARVLAQKDKSKLRNYKHVLANQRNVRLLLGFMEALEKAIYNAAEGNAFGIPPPEKPARTFFRLNISTCSEWFTRNRMALHLLALHCMELEMVIRSSICVLSDMAMAGKTNEPYFEQVLLSLVWAYLRNFESDALFGLYIWIKSVTGKKLQWIKGAAEQAAGHREIAADCYTKILKEEKLEPAVYDFINDQRKISLMFAGDFEAVYTVVSEEEANYFKPSTTPILTITADQMASYVKYDRTKDPAVLHDMTLWETLETAPNVSSNFSVHKMISLTENTLAFGMLGQGCYNTNASCWEILHTLLQECNRTGSQEYLVYLNFLNHVTHKVSERYSKSGFKNIQSLEVHKKYGSLTIFLAASYSDFFDDYSDVGERQSIELRLDLVSSARKESNYRQCIRELKKVYQKIEYAEHVGFPPEPRSLDFIKNYLMSPQNMENAKVWTETVTRTVYEHSKFLYIANNQHSDAIQFAASAALGINNRLLSDELHSSEKLIRQCVKFYLKLSEWIQCEPEDLLDCSSATPLKCLVDSITNVKIDEKMPLIDAAMGKLIQKGVEKCPEMPKAWSALGAWSYRWGRKMVESKTDSSHGLRPIDASIIIKLVPEAESDDIEQILKILNEQHVLIEDEDIGPNESSSTELIESQLRMIPILANKNDEFMNCIIELWKQAHREVYGYYEMCALSYFKFLLLSSNNTEISSGDSSVVTATLRLLRLIVKHALGLQDVLEEGLAQTPSDPWKVIIPQLFSRLNHHEPYVRRRVSELLCRVATDSPHLIIFPTVVGAQEKSMDVTKITDSDENQGAESRSSLTFCFTSLLDTLSTQSPKTVGQVQMFVRELRRISLLWDELWLLSLSQVFGENAKKFQNFDAEFQKTDKSPEKIILFTEKYRLLMRPVLFVLERLQEWTSKPPETNNERNFQEKFSKLIDSTVADMRKPFDSSSTLLAFNKFKLLYQHIQQRVQKRMSYTLKMNDISPILANLQNTLISMPGIQPANTNNEPVYIQSVDNTIQILPTKTKPKKLAFYGSDGKRYTYLFKGMEDLHLDERIMQFLSIANLMMKKSVDSDGKETHYRAHHYSVIPLGPRSGLISWVDGVTPIFSIYKKWQQREAANPRKDSKPYTVMRPSELYYSKLTPLLKEHGLKPTDNRKDWPLAVQRKVFEELKNETPRDLLSKEFWCAASTAASWRHIVRNYSVSLAVMSVIGYIIGLGDRHLDNMLLKLASGEVVHIDYNICFEKGKTLRVPEKVPFRMTQNLEEALGLTGTEGTFRLSCEHVLKSLKKGRETLLTLLEAFVYDPLVDWQNTEESATGGLANLGAAADKGTSNINSANELTAARKQLEREVTRDTLAIRFTEIKTDWIQNRDDVHNQLYLMKSYLSDLSNNRDTMQRLESQRSLLSKQISLVRECEALGSAMSSHPLNTLSQRYVVFKKKKDDVILIRNILIEKAVESERMLDDYKSFITSINLGIINEAFIDLKAGVPSNHSEFEMLREFLESSNQGQIFVQCEQLRNELDTSALQQRKMVESALEALLQYFNVIKFYPHDHADHHRLAKYSQWCRSLIGNKSIEMIRNVGMSYQHLFGDAKLKEQLPENVIAFSYQIQSFLNDVTYKRQAAFQSYQKIKKACDNEQSYSAIREDFRDFIKSQSDIGDAVSACELTKMTKRFLTIEMSTYYSADDDVGLMDLKANDRWYLDEMKIQTSFISDISDTIFISTQKKKNALLSSSFECFKTITDSLDMFNKLRYDFQLKILPQTMSSIISQDSTVLEMISQLSNIQKSIMPLTELMTLLQQDFESSVNNPNQGIIFRAAELTDAYNKMLLEYEALDSSHVGKHIFLSCHAMFEEMNKISKKVLSFDKMLIVPDEWAEISEIQQARAIFVSPMKTSTFVTLDQIFAVKRIQTMIDFFSLCLQVAWAFKGSGVMASIDPEILSRPLKKYISDCLTSYILGRGSFCLSLIICCLVDQKQTELKGSNRSLSLSQLCLTAMSNSKVCEEYFIALEEKFRKEEIADHLQKIVQLHTEHMKHLTFMQSCHHWLHEDYFIAHPNALPPIPRASLLNQLQTFIQALSNWRLSIQKINEELLQCTIVVLQRLKWASGANPMVNELMKNFESVLNAKTARLEKEREYAAVTLKYSVAILNYEMLRFKTPKTIMSDQEFLNFLQQWENVCSAESSFIHHVNPIEEALVEMLDPEGQINYTWINNVTTLIDDMIAGVHNEIDATEKGMVVVQDNLHMCAHKLRGLISTHYRISADIRNLLKSTLKYDGHNEALKEYLAKYKAFIDKVSELHGNVLSKDFTDNMVKQTIKQVDDSLAVISDIYNDLFGFEKTLNTSYTTSASSSNVDSSASDIYQRKMILRNQSENYSIEYAGSPIKKAAQPNQKEQKRNAYAISIWRRIRMKLEGRDPDPNKSSRVQEQVDWMIREAMNQDNLALLYEGFTAWV